ncbi:MAG: UDP-N-acetylmuramoyl-tripeptide--D-alanyl-D-alanine ligase [Mariprofundus sp.]|nr:UDP-N-acetylmuramoyl-tripeptide--D-alanyl-D-alanine ligase [Mariprofundus sp.]
MRLSGSETASATNGYWSGAIPEVITGVATDTRDFESGQVFLALRGPSFDGHAFASTVAEQAQALIGDHQGVSLWAGLDNSKLEVGDTLQALGDIAHAWRIHLSATTIIAISGSYGKTSLRSMLETGFAAMGFKVAATRANFNNLVGVPQTLLRIPVDADIAVVECGISECGEMARLAAMVQPDIAVLTGITAAHSEGLGRLSGVVREKALLLDSLNDGGWCALGQDVAALMRENHIAVPEQALAVDDAHDDNSYETEVVRWQLDDCELTLAYQGQYHHVTLALPARHWAENFAFTASIMLRFLHDRECLYTLPDVANALAGWQPLAGRMHRCEGKNGMLVLDDSYNANPVSMQAAIDTLRALPGNRIAILGDMAELGEVSESAHAGLDINGLNCVYLIGRQMQVLAEKHAEARWFSTTEEALSVLTNASFVVGDTVLVKASRSMALETVVTLLCSGEVANAL